jgi:peptidoglycan/xylan/chitin deacetylase (PgdA/CDA1 family)
MILLYHHVAPADQKPGTPESAESWKLYFTPEQLAVQLRELTRRGFRIVSLPDLVSAIRRRGWEPLKKVAITFDDGWTDNYVYALPVLRRLGVPATFFVTTRHIHHGVADPARMSVDQLKDLLRRDMTIGSHSRTHPNLLEVTEAQAREEIAGSKTDLERALGTRIDLFAYPYGAHHRIQVDLVRKAGYSAAFSAGGGAQNTRLGMFWLFRHGLSPDMNGPEDRQAFAPLRGTLRGLYRDLRKRLGYPLLAALTRSKS